MQVGATERNGLRLGEMTPAQEKAALALVATTLSREGYQKAMEIADADQVLEVRSAPTRKPGAPIRFGRAFYYVSILGKPSTTDTWMLQFGGHHLGINVTLAGRQNVLTTPTNTVGNRDLHPDGRTIRPLATKRQAFALINALNADSINRLPALSSHLCCQRRRKYPAQCVRRLPHGAQRTMLLDLAVNGWQSDDEAAAAKMRDSIGIADTYFAWGAPRRRQGAYFRLQGPLFHRVAPQVQG